MHDGGTYKNPQMPTTCLKNFWEVAKLFFLMLWYISKYLKQKSCIIWFSNNPDMCDGGTPQIFEVVEHT